jgi:multidrug efflux pump subunit AcrA (membrane-fusion protein)
VVDRVVDAASGTFRVRLELANPGNRIPAGIKCAVRFAP